MEKPADVGAIDRPRLVCTLFGPKIRQASGTTLEHTVPPSGQGQSVFGTGNASTRRMRRAQLVGGYVDIIERDGGWTYDYRPSAGASEVEEVPGIYSSPEEAEAFARNRFEAELVTDFSDLPDDSL